MHEAEKLQMALMSLFCIFLLSKTLNCHVQVVSGQAGIVKRKLIENCFKNFKNSKSTCQEITSVNSRYYVYWPLAMKPNGTAIWGGCVTRRKHRQVNCPGRPGHCPGARRVWRTFCHHGTNYIECWCDRGKRLISGEN